MNQKAFYNLSYGLYIVASSKNGKYNAQIANTVFQISSQPATIAISINKQNLTHEFIENSGTFSVTVLKKETPMQFIGKFGFKSGRETNKFESVEYKTVNEIPVILENGVAYLIAKVVNKVDVLTHTVFIGEIIDAEVLNSTEPMTYAYYHKVKNGKEPKTAPTYVEEEKKENKNIIGGKEMKKYRCTVCGYIYDPEKGDSEGGIEPGTPFEKLPDDWTCPVCGVTKDDFEEVIEND